MKYLFLFSSIFLSTTLWGQLDYIKEIQEKAYRSIGFEQKLNAYEKWIPLAILIHHKNAKADLDSLSISAERENSELGRGVYLLNTAYYMVENYGDYNKGLELCIKAKDIFEKLDSKAQLVITYNRLAFLILWNQIGKKDLVYKENLYDKYLIKALEYSKELKDKNLQILTLGFIGSYYNVTEEDNTRAIKYFLEAEKLIDQSTPPDLAITILESIVIVYADQRNETGMMNYLNKCEQHPFFGAFGYGRSNMYRAISRFYSNNTSNPDFARALDYGNKSYTISLSMNAPEYISQGEQRLYEIYKRMGNEKQALIYHEKYKQHEDSLARERFQRTYAEYDVIKKEATIKTMENDALMEKNKSISLIRNVLVFSLFAGIFFLFYFFRNNAKLKKNYEDLNQKNKEIELALIKGQSIERKRVAADLHDNLGVQANAILYNSELLKNDARDREKLVDNLYETAKEMLLNLRVTLWALKNEDVSMDDLWIRIINFTKQMERYYTGILFTIDGHPPFMSTMPSTKALNIVMIIAEAINNSAKHSQAKNVIIRSFFNSPLWRVEIIDDGVGFVNEPGELKFENYGMENMKERARASNMKVEVNSVIGSGTTVGLNIQME